MGHCTRTMTEQCVEDVPLTVQSRHRLYTSARQRRELAITDGYGRGVDVAVGLRTVNRSPPWDGLYSQRASFETTLAYYGELHVPETVVETLDLSVGDACRVTIQRC
jgi:hypothetical protein